MPGRRTLFVTHRSELHQNAALAAAPAELDIVMRRSPSKEEILDLVRDAEFLISERTGTVDADIIEAGRNLRLIQRLGAQAWDIDLEAARRVGVPVCATPVRTCVLVAEHMLMLMLALGRRLRHVLHLTEQGADWGEPKRCNENYFAFNWTKREHVDGLLGATVGLLGHGEIATELARRLAGFGCHILYNKRRPLPEKAEAELRVEYASKEEIAERSDYVGCLLPNLPELNQSIDRRFFDRMKPTAMFVHCGAPGVVNEDDLIAALRSGGISGAALDCLTYEPMRPDDPLLDLSRDPASNLLVTPHIAAGTVAASRDERIPDYANLLATLRGEPLRDRIA